MDRVLSPKELAQLFKTHEERRVLSTSLTRLQFKVDRLTPDIFVALPDLFPNLENLQIECSGVEGNAATRGYKPEFTAHLEQYEDRLKAWTLKNLTLGLPKFTWMSLFEQDLVKFFPNITLNPVM
ncbi:hypothetical protein NLJ89_g10058 [Agrocybe chaxingu]|uniref:Uncharacterized protein n=1 Tax=Agrocybe chaxingu TaxID=84603 RepID=A0A9W8MSH4_9AGAR|nr:hypothetical protein NLJ89_g10058 [Agrocybe chaxingu]